MTTYLLLHTPLLRLLCCRLRPRGREGESEGGRANRERSHRHYILSLSRSPLPWQLPPHWPRSSLPFRKTIAATPDVGPDVCMYAACMLMLAGLPLVMEEAVRNYSRRKVQRQPQCRAFFRSDAPTNPPAREAASVRAGDEFALAGPSNKSVRIGFVQKAPPSFSPPGKKQEPQKWQGRSGYSISSPGKTRPMSKETTKRGAQASSGGEGLLSPDKARHSIRAAAPCNGGALSDGAEQRGGDKV